MISSLSLCKELRYVKSMPVKKNILRVILQLPKQLKILVTLLKINTEYFGKIFSLDLRKIF